MPDHFLLPHLPSVSKTVAYNVLRKSIITVAKHFSENLSKVKVPEGQRRFGCFHCVTTVVILASILIILLFLLLCFPDDCAKSLTMTLLNPAFTEKVLSFTNIFFI